jgi:transcription termination/antitermination protein NusG
MTISPETPWYAVYTRSRQERPVERILRRMELESYLPLRQTWSSRLDRKQVIEVPALPGYLFVSCMLTAERRAAIKRTLGVVHLVENGGRPCVIPPEQIASLRQVLAGGLGAEEHPYPRVGERVRVARGPLEGARGYLTRVAPGKTRLVVAIEWVDRAVSVEIDVRCLERDG